MCPDTGTVKRFRFPDCRFDESIFPKLSGNHDEHSWTINTKFNDPLTKELDDELYKTINLWQTANLHPQRFALHPDASKSANALNKRMKKLHIQGEKRPSKILEHTTALFSDIKMDAIEPKTIQEARKLKHWPQWKQAIQDEIDSLITRGTFSKPTRALKNKTIVGS